MDNTKNVQVVAGIIRRDDKILVCERPRGKPYSGYWEFPGGKLESNESNFQALIRECREELNIEVTKAKHWIKENYAYPDKTVLLDIWLIESFLGEPCGQEAQKLQWATLQDIKKLRMLEGNWTIIERLAERR